MATLLTARHLSKTYSTHTLFTDVAISLVDGDRVGLIGPNGSGKSTLMKILCDIEHADAGDITRRKQLRLAYVAQDDRFAPESTPLSAVVSHAKTDRADQTLDPESLASITLSKLGFVDFDKEVNALSGGWKKRLSIACALVNDPDVLMLDEPTNHLHLEGVIWLESFVRQANMAVVFVTHDRTFLEGVAGRIIELSRAYPDGTFEVKGNYSHFVRRKEEFLNAQAAQQSAIAGKVRRDTAWLEQGIQGRQTRNKTQVADAANRRAELKAVSDRNKAPKLTTAIEFQATERKTNKLLTAHRISKSMGDKLLFERIDLKLSPGMCLGLLGPNGSGKTTLLRLLTDELKPDSGNIKRATDLRVVNFTQHRDALNPTQKLREALCPIGDTVEYRDKAIHVSAWAKKFLFDPAKFNISVGDLSGGEQARIMIANLMLQPADVLVLDEPTNDLDIPSLEVLEQTLSEFPGAIVLVTHDRFMLARLSTELLALDGEGGAKNYITYHQWQDDQSKKKRDSETAASITPTEKRTKPATPSKKLSYKLQRELDMMEETILEAESKLEALQAQAGNPDVVAERDQHAKVCEELGQTQLQVQALYDRWAELEGMNTE